MLPSKKKILIIHSLTSIKKYFIVIAPKLMNLMKKLPKISLNISEMIFYDFL